MVDIRRYQIPVWCPDSVAMLCVISESNGQVSRKDENEWVKRCIDHKLEGVWLKGRPKKTWMEVVKKVCRTPQVNKEDAEDCSKWNIKDTSTKIGCEWANVLFFCYWLTQIVFDKQSLNGLLSFCDVGRGCCTGHVTFLSPEQQFQTSEYSWQSANARQTDNVETVTVTLQHISRFISVSSSCNAITE